MRDVLLQHIATSLEAAKLAGDRERGRRAFLETVREHVTDGSLAATAVALTTFFGIEEIAGIPEPVGEDDYAAGAAAGLAELVAAC